MAVLPFFVVAVMVAVPVLFLLAFTTPVDETVATFFVVAAPRSSAGSVQSASNAASAPRSKLCLKASAFSPVLSSKGRGQRAHRDRAVGGVAVVRGRADHRRAFRERRHPRRFCPPPPHRVAAINAPTSAPCTPTPWAKPPPSA